MKLLSLLLALTCLPTLSFAATCSGGANCHACKNCRYCKHCAKEGGTCSVCSSKYGSPNPSHNKTKKRVRKH